MGNSSSSSKYTFDPKADSKSYSAASDPPDDAPPPYSTAAGDSFSSRINHGRVSSHSLGKDGKSSETTSYLRVPMRQTSVEDALETLRKYDTVILLDDSLSMAGPLWKEARDALAAMAATAGQYDADGIDVYFLNDPYVGKDLKSASSVREVFNHVSPSGLTPIAERLEQLVLEYLATIETAKDNKDPTALKAIKPVNYLVITDGIPTDDPEPVIVNAARRLDARNFPVTQLGIQFVQIGDDKKATEYLQELDNGLSRTHGIRDIVDTTPYTGGILTSETLTKILIGGINRRVDRKGAQAVMA